MGQNDDIRSANDIRTAMERNVKAVTARPGVGQGTARTTARLNPGLECEVTDGPFSLTVGMTAKYGGTNAGPNPGVLGRGALASCMAMGYAMWAARLGVPLQALEVEVQADYDVRGELGVEAEGEDLRPGYRELRYVVTVESSAPEEDIIGLLDRGDECSPYLDIFANRTPVRREVRIREPEGISEPSLGGS
ncbi:MAG: OsmC family protein [Gemmatimonadota bacterium]